MFERCAAFICAEGNELVKLPEAHIRGLRSRPELQPLGLPLLTNQIHQIVGTLLTGIIAVGENPDGAVRRRGFHDELCLLLRAA